ncbi:hypothetical protein [Pedobacter sp.]|uniref:hypothetical protein n=1 Tax=Pedobacter sp. TaxID=1411316 RepID=UPI0031E2A42F
MSIYFQYPTIDEYQTLPYPAKEEKEVYEYIKDEDRIIKEQFLELKDYLTLKQI